MDKKELITVLSAQKEEQRVTAISKPGVGSLGKFVNSMESLQQRLDGFTLDEIIEAERQANTLKGRLIDLQLTVMVLSDLKQKFTTAAHAIEEAPVPNLRSLELETATRPLRLQQLLAASSKLIPFPRPTKPSREKQKHAAAEERKETTINKSPNEKSPARAAADQTQPESPAQSRKARSASTDTTAERSKPKASKQKETAPKALESTPEIAPVKQIPDPQERPDERTPPTLAIPTEATAVHPIVEPEFPPQHEVPTEEFDFSRERSVKAEEADHEVSNSIDTTAGPEMRQVDFDQRLLDDLIKNYGEFAASPNLPAVVQPEIVENEPKNQKAASGHTSAHTSRKSNVPLRKEAEIDRQLKQIIKDYGQYDLYSHPGQTNLKRGVIAAFALLGVLFFVFYFFSSPTPPRHPNSTQQQESIPVTPGDKGLTSNAESDVPADSTSKQQKN